MDHKTLPDLATMRETLHRVAAAGGSMMLSGRPGFSPAGLLAAHAMRLGLTQGLSGEDRMAVLAYLALRRVEEDAARERAAQRASKVGVPA